MLRASVLIPLFVALAGFKPYEVRRIEGAPKQAPEVTTARYPGADAVVLDEEAEIRLFDPERPSEGFLWTEQARIKVLSPAGRAAARVHLGSSKHVELISIGGRSYSAGGDVRELSGKPIAFFGDAEPLSPMYSDRASGFYDVPGVEVGDIVEYRIVTRWSGPQGLPGWYFDRFDSPVVESRIVFTLPEGWHLDHVLEVHGHATPIAPETKKVEGGTRSTFVQRDLPALEAERLGPQRSDLGHLLLYAIAPPGGPPKVSWDDIAGLYRRLSGELEPLPADALARAQISEKSPRAIFEWVRDHVRYVAIHEGLGAIQPHAPGGVLEHRWGDCKDEANLLLGLYALAGIEAYPVLVGSLARGRVKPELPRVEAFDHVIVALPKQGGGHDFVDPTAKSLVFGELHPQIQGQPALIIRPSGSELIDLPWTGGRRWVATWTIDQDHLTLAVEAVGEDSAAWRDWPERSLAAKKRAVRRLLADRGAAAVEEATIVRSGNTVHIEARFRAKSLTVDSAEGRFIVLGKLLGSADEYRVPRDRRSPVELGPPSEIVERVIYRKGAGEKLLRAPKSTKWAGEGIAFELSVEDGASDVTVERKLSFTVPRLAPERFSDLSRVADLIFQSSVEALLVRGAAPLSMNEGNGE